MLRHSPFPTFLILSIAACGPRGEVERDPANPAPVAGPEAAPTVHPPAGQAGRRATGRPTGRPSLPGRADQAPLVRVEEVLGADSLLGRRVRVSGRCTAAGAGRRSGSWTLEEAGASIEVRGLVPPSCAATSTTELTIFAQIEPAATGSSERLLLRLPD